MANLKQYKLEAQQEIARMIVTRSVSEGSVPHLRFGLLFVVKGLMAIRAISYHASSYDLLGQHDLKALLHSSKRAK